MTGVNDPLIKHDCVWTAKWLTVFTKCLYFIALLALKIDLIFFVLSNLALLVEARDRVY